MLEVEAWRRHYEEEHARAEELAQRLAATEAAMEALQLKSAEAEQAQQVLSEELVRGEVERHALEEHNAQLQARQRELTEIHDEMADVWFESALSRARRHSAQPESSAPATAPATGLAPAPGGGQGAAP